MSLGNDDELEKARLQNLEFYNVLDTPREDDFQKITSLASAICQMPIALVSLIDHDRQWFKANVGLKDAVETPREISFCTHAIKESEVFEVQDALKDERFKNNPLVLGNPFIRFYAGAQLKTPEGFNIGTLCVINQLPGKLSNQQKEALSILADQVVELLVLRKKNLDLIEAQKTIREHHQLLLKRAKLQTIGELASGVCHQINNPLAIILGRSMILKTHLEKILPPENEAFRELDVIGQTTDRISTILKALRSYSKDLGDEMVSVNLYKVIEEAITLTKGRINSKQVNLVFESGDEITVKVNLNQLSQVLINLINNAVDAMEDSEDKNLSLIVSKTDEFIEVRVSDTGPGIDKGEESKIFEPFFTKKARNFGVGLSNALHFMELNQGKLILEKPRSPTTFLLRLPRSA